MNIFLGSGEKTPFGATESAALGQRLADRAGCTQL